MMKTINDVNVKQGNQSQGAFQVITARQLGLDTHPAGDVAGYIYETDQERGFICAVEKNGQVCLYSNIMPLSEAQAWARDEVSRIASESKPAAKA